jgi:hypothetical protein
MFHTRKTPGADRRGGIGSLCQRRNRAAGIKLKMAQYTAIKIIKHKFYHIHKNLE